MQNTPGVLSRGPAYQPAIIARFTSGKKVRQKVAREKCLTRRNFGKIAKAAQHAGRPKFKITVDSEIFR